MAQQFSLKSLNDGAETQITGQVIAGRNPDCGLRLPDGGSEGGPSRKHAQLSIGDGALWVEDLGSKNGTFVNDQRVTTKTRLRPGDKLRFDRVGFIVHAPAEDVGATVMRPAPSGATQMRPAPVSAQPATASAAARPAPVSLATAAQPAARPAASVATQAPAAAPVRPVPSSPLPGAPPPAPVAAAGGTGTKDSVMPGAWADPDAVRLQGGTELLTPDKVREMVAQPAKAAAPIADVDVPTLTCVSGPEAGRCFKLEKTVQGGQAAEWHLGSDADQDVQLSGDGVSGKHASIVNEGLRWKIVDRLSSNGTFVNNRRAVTSFLSSGDEVRLGTVSCVFALPGGGGRHAPQRSWADSLDVAGLSRKRKGRRIDVPTLVISFVVTVAIIVVAWRFFMT